MLTLIMIIVFSAESRKAMDASIEAQIAQQIAAEQRKLIERQGSARGGSAMSRAKTPRRASLEQRRRGVSPADSLRVDLSLPGAAPRTPRTKDWRTVVKQNSSLLPARCGTATASAANSVEEESDDASEAQGKEDPVNLNLLSLELALKMACNRVDEEGLRQLLFTARSYNYTSSMTELASLLYEELRCSSAGGSIMKSAGKSTELEETTTTTRAYSQGMRDDDSAILPSWAKSSLSLSVLSPSPTLDHRQGHQPAFQRAVLTRVAPRQVFAYLG